MSFTTKVILAILSIIILISGGCVAYWVFTIKKTDDTFDDVKKLIAEEEDDEESDDSKIMEYEDINGIRVQKKYADAYRENNDLIGWLKIHDTDVDYPVMQTAENEYYINKDFYKNYSAAGTPFLDNRCKVSEVQSDNLIIYGHNMRSGSMFKELFNYEKNDYYRAHQYIQFNTLQEDGRYKIISIFRTRLLNEDESGFRYDTFFNANDEDEFTSYINNIKRLSMHEIEDTAEYREKLLTLSTCAYHTKNGRLVVVAKRVK